MAGNTAEEEVWKCPKHPSKRRRNGICPICLSDRLGSLCPNCANERPCGCMSYTTSSSSSSSSSFSFFSGGEGDASLRRSRSVAFPFIRTASRRVKTVPFLSVLRRSAGKKTAESEDFDGGMSSASNKRVEDFARIVTRSRSVSSVTVETTSGIRRSDVSSSPARWKLWNFPSPMKMFRMSKSPKVIMEGRSSVQRG